MQIELVGRDWRTELDFIDAVIAGVNGPIWHGRNYNALYDSLVVGSINGINPPYDFIVNMPVDPTPEVVDAIAYFLARITEWRRGGAEVSAQLKP